MVCVGLDPDLKKIPEAARPAGGGTLETIVNFNKKIIDATRDLVCAYKPNSAFYEAHGDEGWNALRETIQYIQEAAPDVAVILDAKRGDTGNTNRGYAEAAFVHLRADAVTVNPYMGGEPLSAFFDHKEKGVIVLCHTSNPGAHEIQGLSVCDEVRPHSAKPLYKVVARLAATEWNGSGNCSVMVGATFPEELAEVRKIVGEMPILIAGVGAQDGDLQKAVEAGVDSRKRGLIVNASRSIIFASRESDFAEVAQRKTRELDAAIKKALQ